MDVTPDPLSSLPSGPTTSTKKKSSKRQDSLQPEDSAPASTEVSKSSKKDELDITKIRAQHEKEKSAQRLDHLFIALDRSSHTTPVSSARQSEIEKMEADIRKLTRKARGDDSDEERSKKKPKKSYLEEEMAKYAKSRNTRPKDKDGKRKKDEGDVLAALSSFRSKLQKAGPEADDDEEMAEEGEEKAPAATGEENPGIEVDDDVGFMSHLLHFPKDNSEEVMKAERDYEVIDPRQRGARAKEEERERKRTIRPKDGGRGFRRH